MGLLKKVKRPQRGYLYGIRWRWLVSSFFVVLIFLAIALGGLVLLSPEDALTLAAFRIALGVGLALIVVMFVTSIYFLRTLVLPINQVTSVAHRISEGSYGIQLSKQYPDEVGELTDAINDMSMRLNQAETLKTEFISSVSHELRTPLTAISGWGETLLYDESLSADNRRGLEIILGEARRLSKLVEELLEFTRMEDGRFTLNIQQIDIAQELGETIFTYREHLRRDGLELGYEPYSGDLPLVPGDPERLRQVFYNILDNAAKHGRDGGKIAVRVTPEPDYIAVEIRDFGPGIPLDEIEHVKMKFYKGSSSKERGSGIGLAVCEEIVRYHDGRLEIQNAEDRGLSVTVKLPIAVHR
ncbi:MAG: HAMP domain-containing histidine kinase [Oscillospiraceae bacterium]|nr:HAMP domain-containing histidine kinase [Oscillospiraceae bacterium]